MTHTLWLKKQKLIYSKDVFDILQFGSSIFENSSPNDVDIAVIFQKIPLKEQLSQAQEIKKQLQKKTNLPLHIKSFDLYSLFESSNFAKESILFYGKSLITNEYFSRKLGLTPVIQIEYSLKKLAKKDKIKFNYLLNGKKEKYGLLRKYGGSLTKPGQIEIKPEHEKIFVDKIKEITNDFKVNKKLVPYWNDALIGIFYQTKDELNSFVSLITE